MIKRVDSGGQVHLVTNIRKPRKWRRYEYLESSGTLWIDTGIKLSLTDKFEFETDFTYSPANSTAYPFYGTEDYRTGFMALYHYLNNGLYPLWIEGDRYGGSAISITASSRMYSKTVIDVPNKTWAIIYNTTSVEGTYSDLITDTTSTVKFFGNDLYSSKYVTKCYYFKIKINDILVRDFVPAQYNGLYGMWDLVEDRFYPNKGTGSFTVGQEIKNYDEIDEVRKTTSLLPAGVELYDYILSSDTLYIDTGYKPNGDTRVVMKFLYTSYNSLSALFGARNGGSSGAFNLWCMSDLFGAQYNDNAWGDNKKNVNLGTSEPFTVDYNKNICTVKGVSATFTKASFTVNYNLLLLALLGGSGVDSRKSAGKLYYCQIYDNGTLIRNFIPCTYLGEPGMWDTVENKFYRNQGTGQFTLGNKITLKEYEYLLTNATNQSIDTGILLTDNHSIAYDIIFKYENNGVRRLMGPSGSSRSYFGANSNGKYDRYSSISIGNIDHLYEEFNLITKKLVSYINDFKYREDNIAVDKSIGHCYIFSLNGINNYTGAGQYFYSGKMIYDGEVIRDFIPVSYNGTPGLWDKVEWKFYENAGSGSFTLGPEKANGTYPVSYLYDKTIYEEPDGSRWLRIAHHNDPSTRRFTSSDSFTTYIHTSNDLFFDVSWCNTFTLWELMVKLKTTSETTEQKFRWIQNYNPMTATFDNTKRVNVTYNTSSGYTVPMENWGGLMKIDSANTYLCGNNGSNGLWWGATGCKRFYSGGLPGWNNLGVTTGYLDLYIRIA